MSDIEFCPECEAPVIGFGDDIRCTDCGWTISEMDGH
jgi:tRNA(Ile2) C34 agmatinyltransferase TiaS